MTQDQTDGIDTFKVMLKAAHWPEGPENFKQKAIKAVKKKRRKIQRGVTGISFLAQAAWSHYK